MLFACSEHFGPHATTREFFEASSVNNLAPPLVPCHAVLLEDSSEASLCLVEHAFPQGGHESFHALQDLGA
jgi:hypothetical protein